MRLRGPLVFIGAAIVLVTVLAWHNPKEAGPVSQAESAATPKRAGWQFDGQHLFTVSPENSSARMEVGCDENEVPPRVTVYPGKQIRTQFSTGALSLQTSVIYRADYDQQRYAIWFYNKGESYRDAQGNYVAGRGPETWTTDTGLDETLLRTKTFFVAFDPSTDDIANLQASEPEVGYLRFDVEGLEPAMREHNCRWIRVSRATLKKSITLSSGIGVHLLEPLDPSDGATVCATAPGIERPTIDRYCFTTNGEVHFAFNDDASLEKVVNGERELVFLRAGRLNAGEKETFLSVLTPSPDGKFILGAEASAILVQGLDAYRFWMVNGVRGDPIILTIANTVGPNHREYQIKSFVFNGDDWTSAATVDEIKVNSSETPDKVISQVEPELAKRLFPTVTAVAEFKEELK